MDILFIIGVALQSSREIALLKIHGIGKIDSLLEKMKWNPYLTHTQISISVSVRCEKKRIS